MNSFQIFISTHTDKPVTSDRDTSEADDDNRSTKSQVDLDSSMVTLSGVWSSLAPSLEPGQLESMNPRAIKGLLGHIPSSFPGLATPGMNPMSMQLSHEEVVVGCADGTI